MNPRVATMPPKHRHFLHAKPKLPRQKKNLRIESPALDPLQRQNRLRGPALNALNPHCVSLNCSPRIIRCNQLKTLPKNCRCSDCLCVCNSARSQREPIAISAPEASAASNFGISSIGEDRSASLNTITSPRAFNMPLRTA